MIEVNNNVYLVEAGKIYCAIIRDFRAKDIFKTSVKVDWVINNKWHYNHWVNPDDIYMDYVEAKAVIKK